MPWPPSAPAWASAPLPSTGRLHSSTEHLLCAGHRERAQDAGSLTEWSSPSGVVARLPCSHSHSHPTLVTMMTALWAQLPLAACSLPGISLRMGSGLSCPLRKWPSPHSSLHWHPAPPSLPPGPWDAVCLSPSCSVGCSHSKVMFPCLLGTIKVKIYRAFDACC